MATTTIKPEIPVNNTESSTSIRRNTNSDSRVPGTAITDIGPATSQALLAKDAPGKKPKKRKADKMDNSAIHNSQDTGRGGTGVESQKKLKIKKLAPPRPFPSVPSSVSATGPRSAHTEGKNMICISRNTSLGAYLRRCKDLVLKDGYKTLRLSAMGAAIPHLTQLVVSLPLVLPHAPDEIQTSITTGTVEVQDEIIPEDEDEDISYRTRGKSALNILVTIGGNY